MNVLIVDDSKAMRCIIARALREMGVPSPYLEAENGRAALETIAASGPDFVISDLNMPEMSGMQLLQTLRESGDATPFGFVTSEASPQLRQEAAEAGASFVVTKPFTAANLSLTLGPLLAAIGCRTERLEADGGDCCLDAAGGLPKAAQMALALSELLRRNVVATACPPPLLAPNLRIVAEYREAQDDLLQGCAVCDFGFGVRASAALTVIPAGAAEEAIRSRQIVETLADNLHEVLNVMTRFFHTGARSHVRLGTIHRGEKPDARLALAMAKPSARVDFVVEIGGYGKGNLSLLSLRPGR